MLNSYKLFITYWVNQCVLIDAEWDENNKAYEIKLENNFIIYAKILSNTDGVELSIELLNANELDINKMLNLLSLNQMILDKYSSTLCIKNNRLVLTSMIVANNLKYSEFSITMDEFVNLNNQIIHMINLDSY